jgi:CheY-like chemotaxis protein
MRVLVVEDEPDMFLEIEDAILQEGGQVVGIATTEEEALELAPFAEIALIDVHLDDGMTGPLIAKSLVNGFGIGVVYVTSNIGAVQGGADAIDVVEKPVTRETVRRAMHLAAAFRTNLGRKKPN